MCAIVVSIVDLGFVQFWWWMSLGGEIGFGVGVATVSGSVWAIVTECYGSGKLL